MLKYHKRYQQVQLCIAIMPSLTLITVILSKKKEVLPCPGLTLTITIYIYFPIIIYIKNQIKKIPLTPLHFSKQKKLLRLGEEITSIPDKKQTLLSFQFKVNPSTNACLHTQLTKATKLLLTECLTDAGLQKEGKCSGSSSSLVVWICARASWQSPWSDQRPADKVKVVSKQTKKYYSDNIQAPPPPPPPITQRRLLPPT